jgi:dTDP-4-dehydrorhamnose reductase
MRVAITGAEGLVGGHLARHLAGRHQLSPLSHRELDVSDRDAVLAWCAREQPELLINCAVVDVDRSESDPERARRVNAEGPRYLAQAASRCGASLLHFSTNYVFDGNRRDRGAYSADHPTHPINRYGELKLAGEEAIRAESAASFIVRTSWVYGPRGRNFLSGLSQRLRAGERVRAVSDLWANATYLQDLAERVDQILAAGHPGTFQLVNSGVCSYQDWALELARLLGMSDSQAKQQIQSASSASVMQPAPRPRWTPMCCDLSQKLGLAPMRSWQEALRDFHESGADALD